MNTIYYLTNHASLRPGPTHTRYAPCEFSSLRNTARIDGVSKAVSVSLPTWKANVGYEEGQDWVLSKLKTGYPRYLITAHLAHQVSDVSIADSLYTLRLQDLQKFLLIRMDHLLNMHLYFHLMPLQ